MTSAPAFPLLVGSAEATTPLSDAMSIERAAVMLAYSTTAVIVHPDDSHVKPLQPYQSAVHEALLPRTAWSPYRQDSCACRKSSRAVVADSEVFFTICPDAAES